jgi:hypothetical protein
MREVLVSVSRGDAVAAVVRDDGYIVLADDLQRGGGGVVEAGESTYIGLPDGLGAVGGLLPPGAVRAVGVDATGEAAEAACGGGAWVALGFGRHIAVRFEDADGRIVRPPLPATWARQPIHDARESCPACGATAWERVTPDDDPRDGKAIVCTQCGHAVREGVWWAPVAVPEQAVEAARPVQEHELPQMPAVRFPVHFVVDPPAPAEPSGRGADRKGVHSAKVSHWADKDCWLQVETTRPRRHPRDFDVRFALEGALETNEEWPDASTGALSLWTDRRDREREALAARAEPLEVTLRVDGEPVPFAGLRSGVAWALVGTVIRGRGVLLSGRGVDPQGLELRSGPFEAPRRRPPAGGTGGGADRSSPDPR